ASTARPASRSPGPTCARCCTGQTSGTGRCRWGRPFVRDPATCSPSRGELRERGPTWLSAGGSTCRSCWVPERPTPGRGSAGSGGAPRGPSEIVSDGLVPGAIQVPPDGAPIVVMADGPTTGGYPKIATVVSADLPLVAQLVPGEGEVRFTAVTVEEAHREG